MDDRPRSPQPVFIDELDAPLDGWDDSVRGRMRWRTLFSKGGTPTDGVTCGVAELQAGDWSACIGTRRWKSITCWPAQAS